MSSREPSLSADAAQPAEQADNEVASTGAKWPDDYAMVHIYPQFVWHCDAEIIGTPLGLQALIDALQAALDTGKGEARVMPSDGEGYAVLVSRTNTTGMNYARLPYIDEIARNEEADYATALRDRIAELEAELSRVSLNPSESFCEGSAVQTETDRPGRNK